VLHASGAATTAQTKCSLQSLCSFAANKSLRHRFSNRHANQKPFQRFNISTFQRASLRDNLNDFFLNRGGSMLAMYDKAPKIALDGLTNVLDGLVAGFTLRSTSR
jgi:hypothetical protein